MRNYSPQLHERFYRLDPQLSTALDDFSGIIDAWERFWWASWHNETPNERRTQGMGRDEFLIRYRKIMSSSRSQHNYVISVAISAWNWSFSSIISESRREERSSKLRHSSRYSLSSAIKLHKEKNFQILRGKCQREESCPVIRFCHTPNTPRLRFTLGFGALLHSASFWVSIVVDFQFASQFNLMTIVVVLFSLFSAFWFRR